MRLLIVSLALCGSLAAAGCAQPRSCGSIADQQTRNSLVANELAQADNTWAGAGHQANAEYLRECR